MISNPTYISSHFDARRYFGQSKWNQFRKFGMVTINFLGFQHEKIRMKINYFSIFRNFCFPCMYICLLTWIRQKDFNRFIDHIVIYGSEYPFLQFVLCYHSFLYRYVFNSFEIFGTLMLFSNKTLWRISSLNRAAYSQRMQEIYFTKIFKKKQHFKHVNINTREAKSSFFKW